MKIAGHSVEVESRLVLNKRELELLHHICSYDNADIKQFAENRVSGHYHGGVTAKEIIEFMGALRSVTAQMMGQIEDTKPKLFKH